jgi:putative transposase
MGNELQNEKPLGRRSIRLPDFDYSQPGEYFITIVTKDREPLFGEFVDGEMRLNALGEIVREVWKTLPARYPRIELGASVVMPDHFHCIINIMDVGAIRVGAIHVGAIHELPLHEKMVSRRRMLIPLVVGYFKMNTAKRINELRDTPGFPVWQRNYHDRIIRSDEEYRGIEWYIANNPINGEDDAGSVC